MEKRRVTELNPQRIKTRAESEDAYQTCLNGCSLAYDAAITKCINKRLESIKNGTYNADEDIRCSAYATSNLNDCNANCLKYVEVQ